MTEMVGGPNVIRRRLLARTLQRARYQPLLSRILYGVGRPVHSVAETISREIARKVRLNGGEATYDGIRLRFPRDVGPGYLSNITWYGQDGFEPHTWTALKTCLEGAGTFLDIGANIGFYSVLAHRIAPNAEILSFEPAPSIQTAARRFLAANGVPDTICPVALSDHNGTAKLYLPAEDHDFGESSANTLVSDSWQAHQKHNEIQVEVARLDSFLGDRALTRPVIVKIDVEDHEAAVLRGASNVIGAYRPIIVCEILPRTHGNRTTVDVLDSLGYLSYAIVSDGCFRFARDDFSRERFFTDFLLLPKEKIDPSICFIPHGSRPYHESI